MSESDRNRIHARSRFARIVIGFIAACFLATSAAGNAPDGDSSAAGGLDVVFVLDNSGSMRRHDPQFLTRAAVTHFAEALAADSLTDGRIAIVLFDGRAQLVQPLTRIEDGAARATLAGPLSTLNFNGQRTDGPAGIERALYELRKNGRADAEKAIIFLTDGKIDTGNPQRDSEATRWLREDLADESAALGIRIFGVAFTEGADYQMLQALALKTRARYYRAFKAAELDSAISDVLARLDAPPSPAIAKRPVAKRPVAKQPDAKRDASATSPASPPAVAAALTQDPALEGVGLLALLPVAILLLAGSFVWLRRNQATRTERRGVAGDALARNSQAPEAQLLDPYGHLGNPGGVIPLGSGRTTLGRDPHSDLVLDNDAVSSQHATIEARDGRYWLEDLRSTNGTRIGGERLESGVPIQLKGGDHIRFGEIDLMFALVGYVPGGGTVLLQSTTSERRPPDEEASKSPEETPGASRAGSRSDRSHISLLPRLQTEVTSNEFDASESARADESTERSVALVSTPAPSGSAKAENDYRTCLDFHLARVEEISPALADFVDRAFDDEMRDAISFAGSELIEAARSANAIEQKSYTAHGIRYLTCAVPSALDQAREEFGRAVGGFTRLLNEALQHDSFIRERCEILAVIVFGQGNESNSTPWVSLSIVPDEGSDPSIDLLSYEFLTEEERREIAPEAHSDSGSSAAT